MKTPDYTAGYPTEAALALLTDGMTPRRAAAKPSPSKAAVRPLPIWDDASEAKRPRRAVRSKAKSRAYTASAFAYHAKRGTWTRHMIDVICAHSDTAAAEASFREENSKYFTAGKRLDWNWSEKKGIVTWQ